jgi:UTP--glucose-1-phosphate uridylyltransferase
MRFLENETEKYGVISIDESSSKNNSFVLKDIVEKPKSNAPSNLAVVGRYVFSSSIFKYLKNLRTKCWRRSPAYGCN